MTVAAGVARPSIAWWRGPTKDQWMAWTAAWLGWMLDAFDFTIFLLILVPIAKAFNASVTAVAAVLTLTLCAARTTNRKVNVGENPAMKLQIE